MRQKIKDIILVILSGTLLALSFPKYNLEFLAWFAFVPLFFAIKGKRPVIAFILSYLCGITFFAGTVYWLVHVTLFGLILLILYLALYFGVFGFLVLRFYSLRPTYYLLTTSALWVILEYLRSHLVTGFGWALLGYSQYLNLPVIQIADITGVWGVSFIIIAVNITLFTAIDKKKTLHTTYYILPTIFVVATLGYGFLKLHEPRATSHEPRIKISVIQGNIPQELKWQPLSRDFIIDRYISLTKQAAQDNPDLIIWPEAASPGLLGEDEWVFDNIFGVARDLNKKLLFGTVITERGEYFNSAILVDRNSKIDGRYDKIHLVPFGEYIPLKKLFGFLETVVPIGDFTAGREYTVFSLYEPRTTNHGTPPFGGGEPHFSVLICFEDVFPELSQQFVKRGADFLVNITNDAWFGKTSSPYQHLSASVFRAVENRVFLVRAANTGISGFINPQGKIISTVAKYKGEEIFVSGYKTQQISVEYKRHLTFYTRFGDIFILLASFWTLYVIIKLWIDQKKSEEY